MSLSGRIREMVARGASNADIIEANPGANVDSIIVLASKARRTLGMARGARLPGPTLQFTPELHEALTIEAQHWIGPKGTANKLALRLLELIVREDLFNAILGE